MAERMRPKGPLEGDYAKPGGGYGGYPFKDRFRRSGGDNSRDRRSPADIEEIRKAGEFSGLFKKPFKPKGYRPERGFKIPNVPPRRPGKLAPFGAPVGRGSEIGDYKDNDPMGVFRPAGYRLPGLPEPDYHWGPYDCGITNRLASRTDNGWLSPESTFACAPGQVFNTDHSPLEYGDDIIIPSVSGGGMPSITLGRRNASILAPRMTLIEHWGWANPVPTGAQPMPFYPPEVGPVPGLKPPEPEPDLAKPSPGAGPGPKGDPDPETRRPPAGDPPLPPPVPQYPDADGEDEKWKFYYGPLWKLYGWLTELSDFIDCFEKSMYGKADKKSGLHKRLLNMMYEMYYRPPNAQQFGEMTSCLYANGATDSMIGKWAKMADQITKSPYYKRPVGPTAGYGGVGKGGPSVRF